LIFFLEPTSGHLRFWNFESRDQRVPASATRLHRNFRKQETLLLRLVRVGQQHVRASWSTDGERFHWLPAVRFGPVRAIGLYNGNSRNSSGNRLAFDDFQVCCAATRPTARKIMRLRRPPWTSADAFLPAEGSGNEIGWPAVRPEARPGAYWWWPGSAVTQEDLDLEP
jgi:hypothetical protein